MQRRRQNLILRANVQAAPTSDAALLKVLARPRQLLNDLASGRGLANGNRAARGPQPPLCGALPPLALLALAIVEAAISDVSRRAYR